VGIIRCYLLNAMDLVTLVMKIQEIDDFCPAFFAK